MTTFNTRAFSPIAYEDQITAEMNGRNICFQGPIPPRTILIYASAEGLISSSTLSTTDPICIMSTMGAHGWQEYARTEVCWNILNPLWIKPFCYPIDPEKPHLLLFDVYDIVSQNYCMAAQTHIGQAQIELPTLLSSPTHSISLTLYSLQDNDSKGYLHLHFFDVVDAYGSFFFKMFAHNLNSPHRTFGKPSPFFVIKRLSPFSHNFVSVFKSSVLTRAHRCDWKKVPISIQYICSGDLQTPIRFSVYDYKERKTNNLIGFFDTTLENIISQPHSSFKLVTIQGKICGDFDIFFLGRERMPLLCDYRLRGLKIGAIIAVDFSSSVVDILHNNKMLHFDTSFFNYNDALSSVVDTLLPFTRNTPFKCWAFADYGSDRYPFKSFVGDLSTPKGVLNGYYNTRQRIKNYPQTAYILPLFIEAHRIASENWEKNHQITILTLLTNGKFHDLDAAIDFLVGIEKSPIIILLVIVGGVKIELESIFKHKKGILKDSHGNETKRRIVKMVTYLDPRSDSGEQMPRSLHFKLKKMMASCAAGLEFHPFTSPEGHLPHHQEIPNILPEEIEPSAPVKKPNDLVQNYHKFK